MRVVGESMSPTLAPGDLVVVDERAYRRRAPRPGELVVARPAALGGRVVVKWIAEVAAGSDAIVLLSDHPAAGCDSRAFGPVTRHELLGPVTRRLWPLKRKKAGGYLLSQSLAG